MALMRQFWHTDDVSRATGNSADRDMWKPSKSSTAEAHPRRQLTEVGGGDAVYSKFLQWPVYRSFGSRQGDNFADPGRTLFLSTRCKCLTLPVMEQCACKIHSQQVLYIEALCGVDMASHGECRCRWCSVDNGSKWGEVWKHLGTSSDALACPKVDLLAADPEDDVGFMGRKPECTALECSSCGFGGAEGIPVCSRLKKSEQKVWWKVFVDVVTVPASEDGKVKAKKLANQTIPKEGKLCDLWAAFKQHASSTWLITRSRSGKGIATSAAWGRFRTVARKLVRKYRVRTRLASCFCTACQNSKYDECHVNKTFPALVPALMDGEVKETVVMVTGVEPVGRRRSPGDRIWSPAERMHGAEGCRDPVGRDRSGCSQHLMGGAWTR